jgi:methyl-accepting chemotaxis protein
LMQENLQELQKLQEEAITREKETEGIIEALANIGSIVWYDTSGNITNIKDSNLKLAGLTEKDMIGKNQAEFAIEAIEDPLAFNAFWEDLRRGQPRRRLFKTDTQTGQLYISELYTPIFDKTGKIEKIINIGFNITEQKLLEEEIDRLNQEIEFLKGKL